MNLSIEEAVARSVGAGRSPPTLRLWTCTPSVIIGLSESVDEEVNLDYCKEIGATVARRFTGGGTVFVDQGNLNFAVSVKDDNQSPFPKDILKSYETLANGILGATKIFGIDARYHRDEIQVSGLKISGFAGANEFGVIFRHGTLLISTNPSSIYSSLRRIKRQVSNLERLAQQGISMGSTLDSVRRGFEKSFNIDTFRASYLEPEEERIKAILLREKYSKNNWNFEGKLPENLTLESLILTKESDLPVSV